MKKYRVRITANVTFYPVIVAKDRQEAQEIASSLQDDDLVSEWDTMSIYSTDEVLDEDIEEIGG